MRRALSICPCIATERDFEEASMILHSEVHQFGTQDLFAQVKSE